jgi:hypothetical protein
VEQIQWLQPTRAPEWISCRGTYGIVFCCNVVAGLSSSSILLFMSMQDLLTRTTLIAPLSSLLRYRYMEIPVVSRVYLTGAFLTTAGCAVDLISPFSLYFNWDLIFSQGQIWRLITSYLFFGVFSVDFLFHMYFLVSHILGGNDCHLYCNIEALSLTSTLFCVFRSIGKIQSTTRRRRISRANSKIRVDVVVWDCSNFLSSILYKRSLFG